MQIILFLFNFIIYTLMKKLVLLLMAALALPVMAQMTATKAEIMKLQDRDKMEVFAPVKAFEASAMTVAEKTRGGYLWDFETEASLEGWLSYDADGDGYGWEIDDYYSYNGGTYCLTSRSYYGGTALTPDNWLVSPIVNLEGQLSIFTENYLSSYPDKIKVYVCVGEVDFDNIEECFVPISDFITPGTLWEEYTFDLSEYEGAEGCFAIRHYDCYDEFRILVDYISLGTPDPVATTPENVTVEPGKTEAAVMWDDEDDTEWNLRYRVYTEPTGYFWDFEDCEEDLPMGFMALDSDGDGYNWFLWDPASLGYDPGDGTALLGTKCATSASYQGVALSPDNYLITPEVNLIGELSFWAAAQDPSYPLEHFAVYVVIGDPNDLDNYQVISEELVATSPIQEYTFDLSEYEGMTGRIAIRHFNCYDMFRLNIDNIMIGTPSEGEEEWIYVNGLTSPEYVITGLDPETTYEVQVQAYNDYN